MTTAVANVSTFVIQLIPDIFHALEGAAATLFGLVIHTRFAKRPLSLQSA